MSRLMKSRAPGRSCRFSSSSTKRAPRRAAAKTRGVSIGMRAASRWQNRTSISQKPSVFANPRVASSGGGQLRVEGPRQRGIRAARELDLDQEVRAVAALEADAGQTRATHRGKRRRTRRSMLREQEVEDPRIGELLRRARKRAAERLVHAIVRDAAERTGHAQREPALAGDPISRSLSRHDADAGHRLGARPGGGAARARASAAARCGSRGGR